MKNTDKLESITEFERKVLEAIVNEGKCVSMEGIAEKAGLDNYEKNSRLPCEIAKLGDNGFVTYSVYDILSGKPTVYATEKAKKYLKK